MTSTTIKLDCPECGVRLDGISYRTDFVFISGVRHLQGGTWVTSCGHEIPNILDEQWDSEKGISTVSDFVGVPLLRWIEGG